MMRLAAVVAVVVGGAVVAACGGDDAAGSTDGAQACVKAFNNDRTGRVLASLASGLDGEAPAHGRVTHPARMVKTEKDDCVLLVGPDPGVLHRIKSLSGQTTWTTIDRSLSAEGDRLEKAAHASDDALKGTVTAVDVLHARTDPQTGRFVVKREG
jgi:hypothetical protein